MGGLKYFHEWGNIEFLTWLAKLRGTVAQSSEFLFRSLAILVTHSLTKSCLLNLIDVTLACENDNKDFVQTLSTVVKILKLKFRRYFEAEVWSAFCCLCLAGVMKLNLGQDSKARFGQDFEV